MFALKLLLLTQFLGPLGGVDNMPSTGTVVVSTATLVADFAGAGAFASPVTITTGGPVTFTRASTATYLTGSTLATASANQLRVQPNGALLEPGATNYILQSGDLSNAAWTSSGTITITANTCVARDGTTTLALLDTTGAVSYSTRYQTGSGGSSSAWTGAASYRAQSGTHLAQMEVLTAAVISTESCRVVCDDGSTPTCTVVPALPADHLYEFSIASSAGVCRLAASVVLASATAAPLVGISPGQYPGVSADVVCAGEAQVEPLLFATSYIPTSGTATARATETATVNAVGVVGAATGSGVLTYTPEWSTATAGADRVLLSTTGVVLKWLNGSTAISVTAGGATATSAALTWTAFSSHVIRYRYGGGAGVGACVQVDGATEVCAGTFAAITPTNPLYLNGDASGGSGGSISGLKICSTNAACN